MITIAAWSVIAVGSTVETYLYTLRTSDPASFAWLLASQVPGWGMWALATGPIVALSRRFTFDWPLQPRSVAVHAAACFVAAAAFAVIATLANLAFPWKPGVHPPLPVMLWQTFLGWSVFMLMAYASIVGVGHALEYAHRVRREQTEKAVLATHLVEAQLGALRMQLQPHFLFNTLNSVAMLIRSADHARAVEMIALLGDVLRSLLRSSSDLESTLAAELDFLRRYLEIEQVRFGDRLQVRWSIAEDTSAALVPPLILQPLVENALRHGLWPHPDGGELAIVARRIGAELELEVIDEGVGLAPALISSAPVASGSPMFGPDSTRCTIPPRRSTSSLVGSVVWLPGPRVLWVASALTVDADGRASPSRLAELEAAIAREHLDVDQIVGAQLPPTSWAGLRKAPSATAH